MSMPTRVLVTYQRRGEPKGPEELPAEVVFIRMFEKMGYEHYMTHEKTNAESGLPERTLEFLEVF